MAIVIEAMNVVIRNATVEQRVPGGIQEYQRACPNRTFCTDGQICRVGFMVLDDALQYIDELGALGFIGPTSQASPEVALIAQGRGFLTPCDWLELGQTNMGGSDSTEVVWLQGAIVTEVVAPEGWEPNRMVRLSLEKLRERKYVETEGGVEVYQDETTGERTYVGRTEEGSPATSPSMPWWRRLFGLKGDDGGAG